MVLQAYSFPDNCDTDGEEVEKHYTSLVKFITIFVSKMYGKRNINAWAEKNKGSSFLHMITTSDMAYSFALVKNNQPVWDEEHKILMKPEDERKKYKAKNRRLLPFEERKRYERVKPLYTSRKGRKAGYLRHGWNDEGIAFYKETQKKWKKVFTDRTTFEKLELKFDDHVRESGFGRHWREVQGVLDENEDEVEEEEEDQYLTLPGDDDFEDERPWMMREDGSEGGAIGARAASVLNKSNKAGTEFTIDEVEKESRKKVDYSDDEEEEDEEEDEEEEEEKYEKFHKNKKRPARVSTGGDGEEDGTSSSSSDSDSESDEEDTTQKKTKLK